MALMFPRVARNYAKAGFYPTDESTLEYVLGWLKPDNGKMRLLDPCAGEGHALMEAAHALGRDHVDTYGIEFDRDRADTLCSWADHGLQSDLFDTVITPRRFSLLWLNPPYGDVTTDTQEEKAAGEGRQRLEKRFYQRTVHLLQYGGIMVLVLPHYTLDKELSHWIAQHFDHVRVFKGRVDTFKQVVVMGVRVKRAAQITTDGIRQVRRNLMDVGTGDTVPAVIPEAVECDRYTVPRVQRSDLPAFYRATLEREQFAREIQRLEGLWRDFTPTFWSGGVRQRPPLRPLSQWHLALSLAAGAISGIIRSPEGRVLAVKGDTFKDKSSKTDLTEDAQGNEMEQVITTDRFVPVIKAWDMTQGAESLGQLLTITSGEHANTSPGEAVSETEAV
ncbi:DUF6094 domain-containing protein [Carnimonas bestiolae]|uniref:DUF6094 domain-containing protein n=1 Tax=Carnimonas bestiolae TaxID=3402172 RepID=UPI003EDC5CF5